mmetsp:Transcript_4429/g.28245  ORF Transcript_4429/g.28245 Transcript_4429/m.28245 type:complete len:268 (+) Transcript_4429:372-1175(+)
MQSTRKDISRKRKVHRRKRRRRRRRCRRTGSVHRSRRTLPKVREMEKGTVRSGTGCDHQLPWRLCFRIQCSQRTATLRHERLQDAGTHQRSHQCQCNRACDQERLPEPGRKRSHQKRSGWWIGQPRLEARLRRRSWILGGRIRHLGCAHLVHSSHIQENLRTLRSEFRSCLRTRRWNHPLGQQPTGTRRTHPRRIRMDPWSCGRPTAPAVSSTGKMGPARRPQAGIERGWHEPRGAQTSLQTTLRTPGSTIRNFRGGHGGRVRRTHQ